MSDKGIVSKEVSNYLSQLKFLVLDPNGEIRSVAANTLNSLGISESQIYSAKTVDEGVTFLHTERPAYLVCFIKADDKEIFQLIDIHKKIYPRTYDRFFLAVANNKSIYTFAQALEEDIDDYIVEPYTQIKLLKKIEKTIMAKTNPSQYKYMINDVKEKVEAKDFSGAQAMANVAMALHPRPSMAFYYLSKIKMLQDDFTGAISEAIQGLRFNKDHYRCLLILHDLYFKTEDFEKAYKVLKKVFKTFPLSMVRIYDMFKLAIMSGSFKELERYCTNILDQEEDNIDIIRFCNAGITICAFNFLVKGDEVGGSSLLEKATKYSKNDPKILRNIFKAYNSFGLHGGSEDVYAKFPIETRESLEFKICAYLREINTNKPIQMMIDEAPVRLEGVHYDDDCFKHLHKRILKEGNKEQVEQFLNFAKSLSLLNE